MSLPTISQLSVIAKPDSTLALAALFTDGQIMLGLANGKSWSWSAVNVPTPVNSAPVSLTYSNPTAVFTKGVPTPNNIPTFVGGVWPVFTVAPALPAGLVLNAATGAITGTPSALDVAANYTVTATNSYGATTAVLNFTVIDAAPANLSYMATPLVATKGTAITSVSPKSTGGGVISYAISPSLPTGLTLNAGTGILAGTATALSTTPVVYTVTATNTGGSCKAQFTLTVNDAAPTALTYAHNPVVYSIAAGAIASNNPSNTGGAGVAYTVSPNLPAGLVMSPTTGDITGTPITITAGANYIVTVTNSGGSTTDSVHITVTA